VEEGEATTKRFTAVPSTWNFPCTSHCGNALRWRRRRERIVFLRPRLALLGLERRQSLCWSRCWGAGLGWAWASMRGQHGHTSRSPLFVEDRTAIVQLCGSEWLQNDEWAVKNVTTERERERRNLRRYLGHAAVQRLRLACTSLNPPCTCSPVPFSACPPEPLSINHVFLMSQIYNSLHAPADCCYCCLAQVIYRGKYGRAD
jgi:hypothetical protein